MERKPEQPLLESRIFDRSGDIKKGSYHSGARVVLCDDPGPLRDIELGIPGVLQVGWFGQVLNYGNEGDLEGRRGSGRVG